MRLLTKSRYKQALECPNKLFYTRKEQYANQKINDVFLQALARGGFQVEELARLHYPDGILIEGYNYDKVVDHTNQLLQQEDIVIFEAAFCFDNLFIRTDILVKKGNKIQLIEVKAKSFHPDKIEFHLSKWRPYLFDLAFQKYVIQKCYPNWSVTAYLMLADKSKTSIINGLNQCFRIKKDLNNRTGVERIIDRLDDIESQSVLTLCNVEEYLSQIMSGGKRILSEYGFEEGINLFAKTYKANEYFNYPLRFGACKKCEFRATEEEKERGLLSGFNQCWEKQMGWNHDDFNKPNLFDVWDFKRPTVFNEQKIIFKEDVTKTHIGYKSEDGKYSRTERQWKQIQKDINGDNSIDCLVDELKNEMSRWKYPLNFIDFETSTSALPFYEGRKPYEQIAFQFSQHIYHENGCVEHASQYINATPGEFPNFNFIRALKIELEKNKGSIFKYSHHENTILNQIYEQLWSSTEPDRNELMVFIQSISHSKKNSVFTVWKGSRDMIDLRDIIIKYYYNPYTKGSNSIKQMLPAIFEVSTFIRDKYSKPLNEINVSTTNFTSDKTWLNIVDGKVQDPYNELPKPFEEWDEKFEVLSEIEELKDGGAALTAYSKIQYTNMSEIERETIKSALLKYCELDTLAMVMIYEHLKEITEIK